MEMKPVSLVEGAVADVVDAIHLAQKLGLEVAVRGGGHNSCRACDDRWRGDDRPCNDEGHSYRPK
jgi:FAD/FMN-containing dehydrogenase